MQMRFQITERRKLAFCRMRDVVMGQYIFDITEYCSRRINLQKNNGFENCCIKLG